MLPEMSKGFSSENIRGCKNSLNRKGQKITRLFYKATAKNKNKDRKYRKNDIFSQLNALCYLQTEPLGVSHTPSGIPRPLAAARFEGFKQFFRPPKRGCKKIHRIFLQPLLCSKNRETKSSYNGNDCGGGNHPCRDGRKGFLQPHIQHGGDQRAGPCAGAGQRDGNKDE